MLYVYKYLNNPDWVDVISPIKFKFLRDYKLQKDAARNKAISLQMRNMNYDKSIILRHLTS
jgi:hypothetical protein